MFLNPTKNENEERAVLRNSTNKTHKFYHLKRNLRGKLELGGLGTQRRCLSVFIDNLRRPAPVVWIEYEPLGRDECIPMS
jgi:hypothetical protein